MRNKEVGRIRLLNLVLGSHVAVGEATETMQPSVRHTRRIAAATGTDRMGKFLERGRAMGVIRPFRRGRSQVPSIDPAVTTPLPGDCVPHRPPRYAQR